MGDAGPVKVLSARRGTRWLMNMRSKKKVKRIEKGVQLGVATTVN